MANEVVIVRPKLYTVCICLFRAPSEIIKYQMCSDFTFKLQNACFITASLCDIGKHETNQGITAENSIHESNSAISLNCLIV